MINKDKRHFISTAMQDKTLRITQEPAQQGQQNNITQKSIKSSI
jgi:hypothetical protein